MKITLLRDTVLGTGTIGLKGKTYEVEENLGKYLINIKKATANGKVATADQTLTIDQVVTAIEQLDKDDDALWTNNDKPTTEALTQALNAKVSAGLRDEAFEAYTASLAE